MSKEINGVSNGHGESIIERFGSTIRNYYIDRKIGKIAYQLAVIQLVEKGLMHESSLDTIGIINAEMDVEEDELFYNPDEEGWRE